MLKPVFKEAGKHPLNTAGLNFIRIRAAANYSLLWKKRETQTEVLVWKWWWWCCFAIKIFVIMVHNFDLQSKHCSFKLAWIKCIVCATGCHLAWFHPPFLFTDSPWIGSCFWQTIKDKLLLRSPLLTYSPSEIADTCHCIITKAVFSRWTLHCNATWHFIIYFWTENQVLTELSLDLCASDRLTFEVPC